MKVAHVSQSDINGGASRAAYRIHRALLKESIESRMLVDVAASGDWTVEGPSSLRERLAARIRPAAGTILTGALRTNNRNLHSAAILPSRWPRKLRVADADVVNMHWIAGEMLSVRDVGRIDKPLVWTLHDMWAFCGAEHYTDDDRWLQGYRRDNRPTGEAGFDLNRWTWNRKRNSWTSQIHIVAPSRWLADCARKSVLMRDWPISVVPYFIDTDTWKPVEKAMARDLLGLPQRVPLALFGALGGAADTRKGFDLLKAALERLRGKVADLELVVFGQAAPRAAPPLGFPIHYIGHLHDELSLRVLYSAADVFVLPSRLDNLPNTGLEAHACGTPVVGFRVGGIPDIVSHEVTGYLADPYEPDDLAKGILQVLSDPLRQTAMSSAARHKACVTWCSKVVAEGYRNVYQTALGVAA